MCRIVRYSIYKKKAPHLSGTMHPSKLPTAAWLALHSNGTRNAVENATENAWD